MPRFRTAPVVMALVLSLLLAMVAPRAALQPAFQKTFNAAGWHTFRIEVTGTAAGASSGVAIRSDGFEHSF
jgi:hypothetical protein